MYKLLKKSKGSNNKPLVALFMMAVLLMSSNLMASKGTEKSMAMQSVKGEIKLAGTTWYGLSQGNSSLEDGTSMEFYVMMTIEFVNETEAKMSFDVLNPSSSGEMVTTLKDVKGTLNYTFDGKNGGSMYLKQFDLFEVTNAMPPFTFVCNSNNTMITLNCWLFEGAGATVFYLAKREQTPTPVLEIEEHDVEVMDLDINKKERVEIIEEYIAPEILDDEDVEEEIFQIVEEMPQFPGGDAKMMEFVAKNIKYPQIARESGIQGRVFVGMVVEPDGSITNVKIIRGIGGGCDEEAMRVIQSMPRWQPGKQRGKAVRVSYQIPVIFKLQ